MKAMVLTGHGGLDKLVWHEDWPKPEPGPQQVLIRVLACGLNKYRRQYAVGLVLQDGQRGDHRRRL